MQVNQPHRQVPASVEAASGAEQEVVQVVATAPYRQHWQQVQVEAQVKVRLCAEVAEQLEPVDHQQTDNQVRTEQIIQVAKAVAVVVPLSQHNTPEQVAAEEVAAVAAVVAAVAAPLAMLAAQGAMGTAWS